MEIVFISFLCTVIKLYHSTTVINLDGIIMDEELRTDTKHPQGHGDMIFFSTKPENYQKEATLSIEVPASKNTLTKISYGGSLS